MVLNISMRSRYSRFVEENDIAAAVSVAQTIELYYRAEDSWKAVVELIEDAKLGFGIPAQIDVFPSPSLPPIPTEKQVTEQPELALKEADYHRNNQAKTDES